MSTETRPPVTGIRSFVTFNFHFFHYCHVLRWLLGMQLLLMLVSGLLFARFESIDWHQGIYFSIITCTSVGYGDITPQTGVGQLMSVFLALLGTILFGQIIAVATHAFSVTIQEFRDAQSAPELEK